MTTRAARSGSAQGPFPQSSPKVAPEVGITDNTPRPGISSFYFILICFVLFCFCCCESRHFILFHFGIVSPTTSWLHWFPLIFLFTLSTCALQSKRSARNQSSAKTGRKTLHHRRCTLNSVMARVIFCASLFSLMLTRFFIFNFIFNFLKQHSEAWCRDG